MAHHSGLWFAALSDLPVRMLHNKGLEWRETCSLVLKKNKKQKVSLVTFSFKIQLKCLKKSKTLILLFQLSCQILTLTSLKETAGESEEQVFILRFKARLSLFMSSLKLGFKNRNGWKTFIDLKVSKIFKKLYLYLCHVCCLMLLTPVSLFSTIYWLNICPFWNKIA